MKARPNIPAQQQEALVFITAQLRAHGVPPSIKEIADHLGIKSTSHAQRIVDDLVWAKKLLRIPNRARSLALPPSKYYHTADCLCGACAEARYLAGLKLIQGLKKEPPFKIVCARMHNIRPLDDAARDALLGTRTGVGRPLHRNTSPREAG